MATNNKYDRQLRLWGASGQRALSETCVILVGASAAGTETMKNLVLPGIGSFVVIDDQQPITDEPYSNFFITKNTTASSTGTTPITTATTTKAESACQHLQELNPDVCGYYTNVNDFESPTTNFNVLFDLYVKTKTTATESPSSGSPGSSETHHTKHLLVIGSDLVPPVARKLGTTCEQRQIPLILVQSYGWFGVCKLQIAPPLPIINPRLRDAPPDLRLLSAYKSSKSSSSATTTPAVLPELIQLYRSIQWEQLDSQQHGHIPYPLILLRALDMYNRPKHHQTESDADADVHVEDDTTMILLPRTFQEKQDFATVIQKELARDYGKELNYQEAKNNAYLAYTERTIDDGEQIQTLLNAVAPYCHKDGDDSHDNPCSIMYRLLQALQQFMSTHNGRVPIEGKLPDMTSSTELYVQLQRIYRDQADADVQEMKRLVSSLSSSSSSNGTNQISDETIATFCSNVFQLDLLQTRTIREEYDDASTVPSDIVEDLIMSTMEGDERPDQLPLIWYLGLDACRLFYENYQRYPGTTSTATSSSSEWESDVQPLQECIVQVTKRYQLQDVDVIKDTLLKRKTETESIMSDGECDPYTCDYAHELCRVGNAELHNIASVVGGVASQEAVKIITQQYVPINNTYVYNGIASTGAVYKF